MMGSEGCAIAWVPSPSTSSTWSCFRCRLPVRHLDRQGVGSWSRVRCVGNSPGSALGPRLPAHAGDKGGPASKPADDGVAERSRCWGAFVRRAAAVCAPAHRLCAEGVQVPVRGRNSPATPGVGAGDFLRWRRRTQIPGLTQFVILGAGFDTRAFRRPVNDAIRSFEVDTSRTQAVKRASLQKAGINPGAVTFVSADFETEDWLGETR